MGTEKKALLVVSFGTSYGEAFPAIVNVEETCRKAFPDFDFFRSFTSKMIIRKLKRTKDITIYSPEEILEQLAEEQYEEVICQPTHIIPGLEYEKLLGMAEPFKNRFQKLCIGRPLMTEDADYEAVAETLIQELPQPLQEDEAFLLMGHGTSHSADSAYCRMEHMLRDLGYHNAFVGTVEGFPDIDYVVKRLHRRHIRKVYMMPFMIVAGDHARNDLAGEKEDSWKSILEREGLETEIILKGIGEIDAVARLYVKHAKESIITMRGKLYGVGVGPGDSELMTLKAVRLIKECDVLVVPVKHRGENSVALDIARGAVDIPDEKIYEVVFSMNKDLAKREEDRAGATEEVKKLLDDGKDVVMVVLGDIGIYSTYSYIHKPLQDAGYEVEMVSGIPSFCAGASKANISIVEGNDGFGVVPSLKGVDEVEKVLDVFENLVIMKVGNHVKDVYELLKARGKENNAIIISNVGMEGEYVGPLLPDREYGYFTTMIIKNEL